jgi:hypothetical protein
VGAQVKLNRNRGEAELVRRLAAMDARCRWSVRAARGEAELGAGRWH